MRAVSKYCSMGLKRLGEFKHVTLKSNNINTVKKAVITKSNRRGAACRFWEEEVKGEKCDLVTREVSVAQSSN